MMILWPVLIVAVIYYLGRENGYFNPPLNNQNYNQSARGSNHQQKQSDFSNRRNHTQENIIDINNNDQALKIARKRYAEGEITKKEFGEIKENLEQ